MVLHTATHGVTTNDNALQPHTPMKDSEHYHW
jgi:hypothetical protein